jgi:hypothetical protein
MTIEVKQLHIKSTVLQQNGASNREPDAMPKLAEIREEILAECKQLVAELLRAQRER